MIKRAFFGVADQAVISIINFSLGFTLINTVSKENYGLYTLGYAGILFLIGIANALIITQMTVIAPHKENDAADEFCQSLFKAQLFFFSGLALIVVTVYCLRADDLSTNLMIPLLIVTVAVSAVGMVAREFERRFYYLKNKPNLAFAQSIKQGLILGLILIGMFFCFELNNMHLWTLFAYGLSGLIVAAIGWLSRKQQKTKSNYSMFSAIRETWDQGRWALIGVTVTWLQSQSYTYLLVTFASAASLAEASASRMLMMPAIMMITGMNQVVLVQAARLTAKSEPQNAIKLCQRFTLIFCLLVIAYLIFIQIIAPYLIPHIFPSEYTQTKGLLFVWGGVFILQAIRTSSSILLQVFQQFKTLSIINTFGTVLVLASSPYLIENYGTYGGVSALALGEILLVILQWKTIHHIRFAQKKT